MDILIKFINSKFSSCSMADGTLPDAAKRNVWMRNGLGRSDITCILKKRLSVAN